MPALSTTALSTVVFLTMANAQFTDLSTLASYTFNTNVTNHAFIDRDIVRIENDLENKLYAQAKYVYANGYNSVKSSGMRTLQGFSTSYAKLSAETYFKRYAEYWNSNTYGDDFVMAALDNTGDFKDLSDVERWELAAKGMQYQNLWYYVIHEMEDAVADCKIGTLTNNDDSVEAWDEAWAFYAGSLEGKYGEGSGHSTYGLAEKRCVDFGTCTGAMANVNVNLLGLFAAGKALIQRLECTEAEAVMHKIVYQMQVPLIQGALRYAYRSDPNSKFSGSTTEGKKERAEGWAFAAAILPQVAYCDSSAAQKIRDNMSYENDKPMSKGGTNEVLKQFQSVYKCLNVTCADVGGVLDDDGDEYVIAKCSDTEVSPLRSPGAVFGVTLGILLLLGAVGAVGFSMGKTKAGRDVQTIGFEDKNTQQV